MSERCPKCGRPWMPKVINLADMPQYCRVTEDPECIKAQRDRLHRRMIDITNLTLGHATYDTPLGRVSRLAMDAIGGRDLDVAETMVRGRKAVSA